MNSRKDSNAEEDSSTLPPLGAEFFPANCRELSGAALQTGELTLALPGWRTFRPLADCHTHPCQQNGQVSPVPHIGSTLFLRTLVVEFPLYQCAIILGTYSPLNRTTRCGYPCCLRLFLCLDRREENPITINQPTTKGGFEAASREWE